ncbi:MarR family transcriptional regulator [Ruminococcus sp. OA3]|uniref:MarR family winged helix-turn-helix transcriptional regulator n=1 Tax=Ruminococcus sp. OA3 TaxID=2914164 RepID=UPI001F0612A7|nr:MarR family transcriptional regulator [Ruminococcus sp. OA3]MCH1984360.1 MarR family transcriptional regulator [Ruminococcus sp. OA3]
MKTEKISEKFVRNLLEVMPNWHSKLVRPFRETLNKEMSLETYYCLETLKTCGLSTMTELAQHMKVPKQQMTKLIDKLCSHGFAERMPNPDDRRVIWIRLTPKAMAYLDEYYLKNRVFLQTLEEQLTEEQLRKLNDAVEVLGEILPVLK